MSTTRLEKTQLETEKNHQHYSNIFRNFDFAKDSKKSKSAEPNFNGSPKL